MRHYRVLSLALLLFFLLPLAVPAGAQPPAPGPALVAVSVPDAAALARFEGTGLPAYARLDGSSVLTGADPAGQQALRQASLAFSILDPDLAPLLAGTAPERLYLAYAAGRVVPDWPAYGRLLLDRGDWALLRLTPAEAARLRQAGAELRAVTFDPKPLRPAGWEPLPEAISPDPLIQVMMDQVATTTVSTYDRQMAGELPVWEDGGWYTIPTRDTYSGEPMQKTTRWIGQHFANDLGLPVEYHQWSGPTNPNVIGVITGTLNPDDVYIICAHVDDVSGSPGADDNGSGSVAVMMAADILSQYRWGCTLKFALWTGEEYGLLGSAAYAQRAYLRGENILGVLNLDMIAWNTIGSNPDISLHADASIPPTLELTGLFSDVVGAYGLDLDPTIVPNGTGGSDQASFWDYGYTAMLGIEDTEYGDFNPYYHSSGDTPAHTDLDYFTQYVKAAVGTFAHMSGCLIPGGIGYLDGHVAAASGGDPIAGARVVARDAAGHALPATTDASGYYTRTLLAGTYTVTAQAYGYLTATAGGVDIVTNTVTTQDFLLATAPHYVVSGTVTEAGSGTPLAAQVRVLDAPVPPAQADPATGYYSITLAEGTYHLRVTAPLHLTALREIVVDRDQTQDFDLEPLPCILLVDDDSNGPDVSSYYTSALDGLGYDYYRWDVLTQGEPTADDLFGYRHILWYNGYPYANTFNANNEAAVAAYLDAGGNFFLSAEDYLYEFGLTAFGMDYLGISNYTDDVRETDLAGVPGNPIGQGLGPYTLVPPAGWDGDMWTDYVRGADNPFRYQVSAQPNSVNKDGSTYRTVFFGWPFEGLADLSAREDILGRIVEWFGGCGPTDGWLVGQVTDAVSGQPLDGAGITAMPGPYHATTDPAGHYTMTLPEETYTVSVTRSGYIQQAMPDVVVSAGLTTTQNFALQPVPVCEPVEAAGFAWMPLVPVAGQVVTYTAFASGTAPITYSWSLDAGVWKAGEVVTYSYALPGVYTVVLTVTNCVTATATAVHTVTVVAACEPVGMAEFLWDPFTPTLGQAVTLIGWASGGWVTETVVDLPWARDAAGYSSSGLPLSGPQVGFSSLALDTANRPDISYCDRDFSLNYAHYNGSTWITETADSAGIEGPNSLALDPAGLPHIGYVDMSGTVKYAQNDGASWLSRTIDRTGGNVSLALDTAGLPHLGYAGYTLLLHAYYDGSQWITETVDYGEHIGPHTSLALGTDDRPRIGYYADDSLRYAYYDGTGWQTQTVDSAENWGWFVSLALDANDQPHLTYCQMEPSYGHCVALRYAHYDGTAWHVETVDDTGNTGQWNSLALDTAGQPGISYTGNRFPKYAWLDGSTWRIETVDNARSPYSSLALDSSGHPHISYWDAINYALKHAWQLPPPTLPITYAWSLGDGTTAAGEVVTHTFALPGTYTVTLTATNACGQAVTQHNIVVVPQQWQVYLPLVSK